MFSYSGHDPTLTLARQEQDEREEQAWSDLFDRLDTDDWAVIMQKMLCDPTDANYKTFYEDWIHRAPYGYQSMHAAALKIGITLTREQVTAALIAARLKG